MKSSQICAALVLSLLTFAPLFAQGVTPSKEHEFLKKSAGEWDFTMDAAGSTMKGVSKNKMDDGDIWLVSDLKCEMEGFKFTGHGLDSYDTAKKKFVAIWVDNMSAVPLVLEGELSADMKTLTMTGKGPSPDGTIVDMKTVTEYKDNDHHTFKLWSGDLSGEPMMTATYVRKKK